MYKKIIINLIFSFTTAFTLSAMEQTSIEQISDNANATDQIDDNDDWADSIYPDHASPLIQKFVEKEMIHCGLTNKPISVRQSNALQSPLWVFQPAGPLKNHYMMFEEKYAEKLEHILKLKPPVFLRYQQVMDEAKMFIRHEIGHLHFHQNRVEDTAHLNPTDKSSYLKNMEQQADDYSIKVTQEPQLLAAMAAYYEKAHKDISLIYSRNLPGNSQSELDNMIAKDEHLLFPIHPPDIQRYEKFDNAAQELHFEQELGEASDFED